jgi:hypothetical protein
MIPGTVIGLQGGIVPFGVYRANYGSSTNSGNFTFSNSDIGAPTSNRVVALVVNYWIGGLGAEVSSISVGGIFLTQRVTVARLVGSPGGSYVYTTIWSGVVPTGDTATISLAFTRSIGRGCQIGIWSIYNTQSATPVSTATATSATTSPANLTLNLQPNDFGIVGATGVYGTSSSFAYTNATERYDVLNAEMARSGADFVGLAVETPRTITVTPSGVTDGNAFVAAAWR